MEFKLSEEIAISIIIPVYNVEKYLRECLDSLLNQTFQDFEIICVDDGSTDKSLEILQEYKRKDDRFVILQQRHSGAGSARNNGIRLAEGKYIQFLDADDYFEPTLLDEMYNHAEKFDADLTVCSSRKVDDEGNITESGNPNSPINIDLTPMEKLFCWQDFKEDIFCLFNVPAWNKLYLKELIVSNNLAFQNLTSCNDVAFGHISKICAKRIVVFNKELVNYRCGRSGSITQFRAKCAENIIYAALEIRKFLQEREFFEELKKSYIKAIKMHISWEISHCNDEQYQKFIKDLKTLMPEDWRLFQSALRKDYITPEYLNKLIGDRKVMLWGASLFIKQVLEKETKKNPNILGIIDRNTASAGKSFCNYTIYPPQALNDLCPDAVILTVLSNNETIYESLQKEFKMNYPNIELLPNIFEGEIVYE